MTSDETASFDAALKELARARSAYDEAAGDLDDIDDALDALLRAPSPSVFAFGQKLQILEAEYGVDAQPRHLAALYADAADLAWLSWLGG